MNTQLLPKKYQKGVNIKFKETSDVMKTNVKIFVFNTKTYGGAEEFSSHYIHARNITDIRVYKLAVG